MHGKGLTSSVAIGVVASALVGAMAPPHRTPPPGVPDLPRTITDMDARAAIIRLERMHGGVAWQQRQAVRFTIEITLGGEKPTKATLLYERTTGRVRMERTGGDVIIFDGAAAWASSEDAATPQARHDALTWPFLLMAPLRLRDDGLTVTGEGSRIIRQKRYEAVMATVRDQSARLPGPSYLVLQDPTEFIAAAVEYTPTAGEGESIPRLVQFDSFETIDGFNLPTAWKFFAANGSGLTTGNEVGTATITDISFPIPADDAFTPGENDEKISDE